MKQRLDQVLVLKGLAPTRSQARDLVRRGCVRISGAPVAKTSLQVDADAAIEVEAGAQPYVSRGGLKLAAALNAFGFDPAGVIALDAGASTGGFSHALLERGAARIYAVDVGTGQLHPQLRADPRIEKLEGCDVRTLDRRIIPEAVGAIVADLSFISLAQALPAALRLAAPAGWLVALIKPQFEVGRAEIGKRGIVRDETARKRAVAAVRDWLAAEPGWQVVGVIPSPISGGSGNVEFLIGGRHAG